MNRRLVSLLVLSAVLFWIGVVASHAQGTEFTYQGRLLSGALPASGSHDFEFRLFSDPEGNVQVGSAIPLAAVNVNNGVFSVRLDFGNQFPGANRYLEIRVKQSGQDFYTVLAPRQAITSSPYAIKSIVAENSLSAETAVNSEQLGGINADQFIVTTDTRLSDARNPLPNSPNYIQNSTTQQVGGNFNITGNGTVQGLLTAGNITSSSISSGSINSGSGYSIGGNSFLRSFNDNTFAGFGTGAANTTSFRNSFFGRNAGLTNGTGSSNSFFGFEAGLSNVSSNGNSFFGNMSGKNNTAASNSFFGSQSGQNNTTGSNNSFFGTITGQNNTTGNNNSFFGLATGLLTTTGNSNSFFGTTAGLNNTTGSNNSLFGSSANSADGLTNATAIGSRAFVGQSNSLVLGSISGIGGCTANNNCETVKVGIGTTEPTNRLTIGQPEPTNVSSALLGVYGSTSAYTITRSISNDIEALFGVDASSVGGVSGSALYGAMSNHGVSFRTNNSTRMVIAPNGDVGIGTITPTVKLDVNGIIRVTTLGAAGSTALCRNASNQISTCSSSIRYKENINSFSSGLSLIRRLRPVSFDWKDGGTLDLGLVAEETAKVEPLLAVYNEKGEVEGVKYDRLGVVLVNAVKQQQDQIEAQARQIDEQNGQNQSQQEQINEQKETIRQQQEKLDKQQSEIEALKKFICSQNPAAEFCQPKN